MEIESIESISVPVIEPELKPDSFTLDQEIGSQNIISGFRRDWIEFLMWFNITKLVFLRFINPIKCYKILKTLDKHRRYFAGDYRIKKIAKVDEKYYCDLYMPGWNSKAFDKFIEAEINRISPSHVNVNRFTSIFIAITKKCPLQCEHCYEWDALNGKEKLNLPDLKSIVHKFEEKGTAQIQISGGEPMLKVNDILELLKFSKKETEFWILTSGFNLTLVNARKLKKAGLTGVVISLDHFMPELHNRFRGFDKSYEWVEHAVQNSIASNLVTALSICVTKSFITESNLIAYAEIAKKMGVSFIQILEPKAVGHYKGLDVSLKPEHIEILEAFYLKMNYRKEYRDYPIISYHGYYQRRIGCFNFGNRHLYIDTDGDIRACPFCQTKTGSALADNIDQSIDQLQSAGCPAFKNASI